MATPTADEIVQKLLSSPEFKKSYQTPLQEAVQKIAPDARRQGLTPAALMAQMAGPNHSTYIGTDGVPHLFPHKSLNGKRVGYRQKSNPYTGEREQGLHFSGRGPGEPADSNFLKTLHDYNDVRATERRPTECFERLQSWGVEKIWSDKGGIYKAALAESSGVAGGVTVPPMFAEVLMTL